MKKVLSTIAGILLVTGVAVAQTHDNSHEKKVSADVSIGTPLRVGTAMLPAGDYKVVCDRMTITFLRKKDGKQVHQAECKGKEMEKPADVTTTSTKLDKDGVRYLDKLILRGSNVEHIFQ